MTSMSTSVSQLPTQVNANTVPKMDDDPMVQDVISEMEMEFSQNQPRAPPPVAPKVVPTLPVHVPTPPQPLSMTQLFGPPPAKHAWLDVKALQKAGIFAAVAVLIFFVDDLSVIYGKHTILQKLQPYDKLVRGVLVAVIFYILLWKLKI